MGVDLIAYQFSRSAVEACDFSGFLARYGPRELPDGDALGRLMNAFVFHVEGWDSDPREIHMIPEVRRFYSEFYEEWPYWLYFCNLDMDVLRAMTLCCMPSVTAMQVDGHSAVKATCDPMDLLSFLKRSFMPLNLMCERAGMSERGIYDRTRAVFEYYGLDFDGGPPPEAGRAVTTRSGSMLGKIGRNDPCPCGSGRKFKKCCGKG